MELLLWMWFYDHRWFFDVKISLNVFKQTWLIPFIYNLFLSTICFIECFRNKMGKCEPSMKIWLFSRAFFSFMISLNIIFFIKKITESHYKEIKGFENTIKVYPKLKETLNKYDFWIRRKSLISTSGILLLILCLISCFWSYMMINYYFIQDKFQGCNENILNLVYLNNMIALIGNLPLFIMFVFVVVIKITFIIIAFVSPSILLYFYSK